MTAAAMKTTADALRWALRRIELAQIGEGAYFERATALLEADADDAARDRASHSGPEIPVRIVIDGKTFDERMQINMGGLAAAIVERALAFTDANDRGDAAGADYERAETDEERSEAAARSDTADEAYNAEKAQLFANCRLMAAARAKQVDDVSRAAIAKALGSAT